MAARRYIPLWRLRRLRLSAVGPAAADRGGAGGPRERALSLILSGGDEFAAARDLLAADPHPLSRRYQADLATLLSDQAEALRLHLQLLAEDPEVDLDVPGWLLRRWGQERALAIESALSRGEIAGRVQVRYQAAIRSAPLRAPLWEELGLLHDLLGQPEEAARCQARALVLDNRQDVLRNREVPLSICEEIVRYAATLDEVVRLVFGEEIWL